MLSFESDIIVLFRTYLELLTKLTDLDHMLTMDDELTICSYAVICKFKQVDLTGNCCLRRQK